MNWDQEIRYSDEGESQPYADLKPCAGCGDDVDIDGPAECAACRECPDCEGGGYIEQAGSCGGGCEFCPPFPRCGACRGTGKRR